MSNGLNDQTESMIRSVVFYSDYYHLAYPYPLHPPPPPTEGNENSEGSGEGGPKGGNFQVGGGLLTEVLFSRGSE